MSINLSKCHRGITSRASGLVQIANALIYRRDSALILVTHIGEPETSTHAVEGFANEAVVFSL